MKHLLCAEHQSKSWWYSYKQQENSSGSHAASSLVEEADNNHTRVKCCIRCFWVIWRRRKKDWGDGVAGVGGLLVHTGESEKACLMNSSLQEVENWATWISIWRNSIADRGIRGHKTQASIISCCFISHRIHIFLYSTMILHCPTYWMFILLTLYYSIKDCKQFLNIATDKSQTLYYSFLYVDVSPAEKCAEIERWATETETKKNPKCSCWLMGELRWCPLGLCGTGLCVSGQRPWLRFAKR